jgi:hypothetical protein
MEREIARIANRQHGVVTRKQLLIAGFSVGAIDRRVQKGVLIAVHRGVYRVGHRAPSTEATYLAAVRACGDEAVLCGRAAAHLLGLIKGRPPKPEVACRTRRRVPGITTRRSKLDRRDQRLVRGIPVTTVPYTLVDLAPVLTAEELARACHEAGVRYRTTPAQVKAVLARRPRAPGAPKLWSVISGDEPATLSELERAFIQLLKAAGLPLPQVNRPAGGHRVDCRWPEHGLTVELDSYRFHNSRYAWEQDRVRERAARARVDAHRRYSWGDVRSPGPTVRELRKLMGWPPRSPARWGSCTGGT